MEYFEIMKEYEVAEKLFEIEKELNLFDKKIQNIYFWKVIRFDIYLAILIKLNLLSVNHKERQYVEKFLRVVRIIKNSFYYSSSNKKVNSIILENPRKVKDECGNYYDLYTKYLIENLQKEEIKIEVIDLGLNGNHYEKEDSIRKFGDSFYFDIICRLFFKIKGFNQKEQLIIEKLNFKLNSVFNIKIDLNKIIVNNLTTFHLSYKKFYSLFKNKENKELYLVCSYGKEGIIKAAQDLEIKVIELQHGAMNKYHVGYSFDSYTKIPYFPDEMQLFGKFWSDITPIPISDNSLKYIGFEDLNRKLKFYRGIKKINKLVFLSQWTVNDELFEKAVEVAKVYTTYQIVFRLHPANNNIKDSFLSLIKEKNILNLKLSDLDDPLQRELSDAKYVVGVYSTAIYEALSFNCEIILLDLYGIEQMEFLINNNLATKIKKNQQINLENVRSKNIVSKYFFGG